MVLHTTYYRELERCHLVGVANRIGPDVLVGLRRPSTWQKLLDAVHILLKAGDIFPVSRSITKRAPITPILLQNI